MPDDSIFAAPRQRHCAEGSFHSSGLVRPDDPALFATAQRGFQVATDFVDALAGGTSPIVPAGVDLAQNFAAASITTEDVSSLISRSVQVANRGGTLLSPLAGGGVTTAGAGWGSHTTIELLPFSVDGLTEELPIRIIPSFSGSFLGSGGGEGLNSRLSYTVTLQTRDSQTGTLTQHGAMTGTVGLNSDGSIVSDGAISQLFVTLNRAGVGMVQAQFRPLDLSFLPETDASLVVTTSFTGFGSFADGTGQAIADGSDSARIQILSFDEDVRFQHATPLRSCRLLGRGGDCLPRRRRSFETEIEGNLAGGFDALGPAASLNEAHSFHGAAATVPEPASASLAGAAGLALLVVGRRRKR